MKQVNETIDGSIKNIIQLKTLDQSLEYSQMYDALESTPIEFQQKLIQALNSIGETLGQNPVEMFNVVLCGNQDEDVRKKLYNWWRGFFEILSSCDIPQESKKEYDEKIDALIAEITKSGSSVDLSEPPSSQEVVSEDYEQASKDDENKMLKDMKFAISKVGEIANKVQDVINFVNPYCKRENEEIYEGTEMKNEKRFIELRNEEVDVTYYIPDHIREPGEKPWFTDRVKIKDVICSRWYTGYFERVNVDVEGESIRVFRTSSPADYDYFKFDNPEDEEKFLEYSDILDEKRRRKFDAISKRQDMNKNINEKKETLNNDENIIKSPLENGQYLIEPDWNDYRNKEIFNVFFKLDSEEDWEFQCDFDTREECVDWVNEEIDNVVEQFRNHIDESKANEKSSGEWVSVDSLIDETSDVEDDEDDEEYEPSYHIGEHVIWDDPDGEASDGWTITDIKQLGDEILYTIETDDGSLAEVSENEICLDDNYKIDEQFNEGFFSTIADGIKGTLKLVGKGLLVFIAGLGGSFLFGFPGLLLALGLAFGIVSGKFNENGKMIVNEGMFGKAKDKIKAVLKLLKTCSKEELKELNDRAKKNPQSVADDIKDLSEGKKDIDELVRGDSLDESDAFDESNGSLEQLAHKYQAKIGEALGVLKNFQDESSKYAPTCEHELVTAIENLEVVKEWVDIGVEQGFDGVDIEDVDESNSDKENDDEIKNTSPKKFKNDNGSTSELVTGCSKKQVSEMTVQQEIGDASELLNLLWGQGRDNLRELRDSDVVSDEFIMSMVEDMMGEEPPTLTAINDLFAYDFESILEPLGIDVEHYRDTLEIVKKNDSVELESTK